MPQRARAVVLASTGTGDIIPNATVTVREPGTSTSISETIYSADDPDLSQYTNGAFFTSATGIVTFYLTDPKRVDVLFTKSGYTSVTIPVDVQNSATGYALVQEEGSNLTARTKLNFIGSGVTAADDAANGRTNVTIAAPASTVGDLLDWQAAYKSADESVTSSTTLQNDDHLVVPLGANQTWLFEGLVRVNVGAEAADIQVNFTVPSGGTVRWSALGLASGVTGSTGDVNAFFSIGTSITLGIDDADRTAIFIRGSLETAATTGNLQFQFAQAVSNATATTVGTGSFLVARRIV